MTPPNRHAPTGPTISEPTTNNVSKPDHEPNHATPNTESAPTNDGAALGAPNQPGAQPAA